jgi:hypothetical protein
MNQSYMKEAVKTAIIQHDHVLLNLTSIILSMAKNHDSFKSFSARCLAAEMLSVEVKTKGEDGNVTRDTHRVKVSCACVPVLVFACVCVCKRARDVERDRG